MQNETLPGKRVSESRTEQVQILLMESLNGYDRLFGGKLMEWIDVVAAVVARRHSGRNVTTAAVDNLVFAAPAHANDTIILKGHITFAGRTSMEICVRTYVEGLSGSLREINTAYLVLVALGDDENPTPVPPVIPETEEEKAEYAEAIRRREFRALRAREHF